MKKLLLIVLTVFLSFSTAIAQKTFIHCGRLIDGNNNNAQTEVTLVIEGSEIIEIKKGYAKPDKGAQVLDFKNKTVLPGLMDMHVHLENETNPKHYIQRFTENEADIAFKSAVFARTTLMAGFTTVRDLGGTGVNIALKNAIAAGLVDGPRVFTAGKIISITGGHGDHTNGYRKDLMGDPGPKEGIVNSIEDAKKAVRQRYKNGADLIKITATAGVLSVAKNGDAPQFTEEEIQEIVKTAKDIGYHVAAHAHGKEGMRRAIIGGVTTIEHGTHMDEEIMSLMKKHGTYLVPTISAGKSVETLAKIPGYFPDLVVPKALAIGPKIHATFSKAYKSGVNIVFGTDAGVFKHGENAKEFGYMVSGGMPAMEAIKSATSVPAKLLDIADQVGTLEIGKQADIIAVDGDPLKDITVLEKVRFVMKGGKIYKNE